RTRRGRRRGQQLWRADYGREQQAGTHPEHFLAMTELTNIAVPIAVSVGAACTAWMLSRKCAALQRRVAHEEAENCVLRGRLDDAVALFEIRVSRLEGVAGSRSKQRRHAADLVRMGGDPLSVAKRCELPAVELQMLLQLDELRERRAVN